MLGLDIFILYDEKWFLFQITNDGSHDGGHYSDYKQTKDYGLKNYILPLSNHLSSQIVYLIPRYILHKNPSRYKL